MFTVDNKYIDNKKKFYNRKEYGKGALALVIQQNQAHAEKVRKLQLAQMEAEYQENDERIQAIRSLEAIWNEYETPQTHRYAIEALLKDLADEQLHKVCVSEIRLTEQHKSTPQKVIKYYEMRNKCLEKIIELNERLKKIGGLDDFSGDEELAIKLTEEVSSTVTQTCKRLVDLRKLTFATIEAIIKWDDYLNCLSSISGHSGRTFEFISDITGRSIITDMMQQLQDASVLAVVETVGIQKENIFVQLEKNIGRNTESCSYWLNLTETDLECIVKW